MFGTCVLAFGLLAGVNDMERQARGEALHEEFRKLHALKRELVSMDLGIDDYQKELQELLDEQNRLISPPQGLQLRMRAMHKVAAALQEKRDRVEADLNKLRRRILRMAESQSPSDR